MGQRYKKSGHDLEEHREEMRLGGQKWEHSYVGWNEPTGLKRKGRQKNRLRFLSSHHQGPEAGRKAGGTARLENYPKHPGIGGSCGPLDGQRSTKRPVRRSTEEEEKL